MGRHVVTVKARGTIAFEAVAVISGYLRVRDEIDVRGRMFFVCLEKIEFPTVTCIPRSRHTASPDSRRYHGYVNTKELKSFISMYIISSGTQKKYEYHKLYIYYYQTRTLSHISVSCPNDQHEFHLYGIQIPIP